MGTVKGRKREFERKRWIDGNRKKKDRQRLRDKWRDGDKERQEEIER